MLCLSSNKDPTGYPATFKVDLESVVYGNVAEQNTRFTFFIAENLI